MEKKKVLKSCVRCRRHKTRCDAFKRSPLPCSQCSKKNLECNLDVVNAIPNRISNDIVEMLHEEVGLLKKTVDDLIIRKNQLLNLIIETNPSISEIQKCIEYPHLDQNDEGDHDLKYSDEDHDFTITFKNKTISLSLHQAELYFLNYKQNYNHFLPIFPDNFFQIPIKQIFTDNNLLFWCIILTSSINLNYKLYHKLTKFIKNLVVETCWLRTPRSVYVISSLLILTTWPIPLSPNKTFNDDLSIKYLSLMKNLALQLGLHRLEFINEFSHKTNMTISKESNLNNLIRERIYKFITINSNYWLINLGLLYLNFNGNQEDYIINKSNNFNFEQLNNDDKYINSLLKISLIQQRLNENLNEVDYTSKLIHLNMFEVILSDFKKSIEKVEFSNIAPSLTDNNETNENTNNEQGDSGDSSNDLEINNKDFINLSIEFSKLQLFLYSFDARLKINLSDYRKFIFKTLDSCYSIISTLSKIDFNILNINSLPIHYKFIIESVALIMLRIYYSPLLNIYDYEILKQNFNKVYEIIKTNIDPNYKLIKIIKKFNNLFKGKSINLIKFNKNFYLINKFNNYQISNIIYEMIWLIYVFENNKFIDNDLNWEQIGISDDNLIGCLDNLDIF